VSGENNAMPTVENNLSLPNCPPYL